MAEPVLILDHLTKFYGAARGIEDLTLHVHGGEVFGLLGPNGAGKTTTLRLVLDHIRPTSGRVKVFGLDAHRDTVAVHRRLGYLPSDLALDRRLSTLEHLELVAGVQGRVDVESAFTLARRLDLVLETPIGRLSHGNKRKAGLVLAFAHRPDLLILDEPTSGLDPLVQREFHRLIDETRREGRTVLLSSHNLNEVEGLCDRAAIVREGRLVALETVETLRGRAARRVEVRFSAPPPAAAFKGLAGVEELHLDGDRLDCLLVGSPDALLRALAQFHVVSLESSAPSLETAFMSFYRQAKEDVHA